MCYRGETNSIRLCDECSANSQILSTICQYFKGNLHSICLCRVYSMLQRMPNSVIMYYMFCLASLPHASFVFVFRCKPGLIWFERKLRRKGGFTLIYTRLFPYSQNFPSKFRLSAAAKTSFSHQFFNKKFSTEIKHSKPIFKLKNNCKFFTLIIQHFST